MNELYVPISSPIHRLDARVKLVLTLAFLVFLGLTAFQSWMTYLLFYLALLAAEMLSRLRPAFFLKRSFLALPFILAALPLIFTGPPPRLVLSLPAGLEITASPEGFWRFVSLALKSWISIQAAILLAGSTRFPDLLTALRRLKLPALFLAIIGLMWRYLAIIGGEAQALMRASAGRSSSLPGLRSGGKVAWRAGVTGGMAGSLFLRSLERSDRVYAAMLSRGYTGDLPDRPVIPLARTDLFVLCAGLLLLTALLVMSGLIL